MGRLPDLRRLPRELDPLAHGGTAEVGALHRGVTAVHVVLVAVRGTLVVPQGRQRRQRVVRGVPPHTLQVPLGTVRQSPLRCLVPAGKLLDLLVLVDVRHVVLVEEDVLVLGGSLRGMGQVAELVPQLLGQSVDFFVFLRQDRVLGEVLAPVLVLAPPRQVLEVAVSGQRRVAQVFRQASVKRSEVGPAQDGRPAEVRAPGAEDPAVAAAAAGLQVEARRHHDVGHRGRRRQGQVGQARRRLRLFPRWPHLFVWRFYDIKNDTITSS